ncbi:MAG: hypothetical protein M5R36_23900 [Deltaproteobacteria bacterium]|nr:hypothetical protein [Deltaproteobacteria bacterium]
MLSAVWRETQKSLEDVFGNWTIADLVEKAEANQEYVANFSI